MAGAKIATSKNSDERRATCISKQHRVGLDLDGLPVCVSARRTGGKRPLTLVARSGGSFHWLVVRQSRSIDACQYRALSGR
jgi:hypothetical protein